MCTVFMVAFAIVFLVDAALFVVLHRSLRPFADISSMIDTFSIVVDGELCEVEPDFPTLCSLAGTCVDHTGRRMLYLVSRFWRILKLANRAFFRFPRMTRWLERDLRACRHYATIVVADGAFRATMRRRFENLGSLVH